MAGKTKQDQKGDADLYQEKSNKGGNEHLESEADSDVDDYYAALGRRPDPNYDRNSNLQIKQAPHDLSPADGGEGFVGSNTGPDVGLTVIQGKKGYSQNLPVWEQKSTFTDYQDNTGSTGNTFGNPGEDSRDEFATWKRPQTDEGLPQTYRSADGAGDAGPSGSDEPDKEGLFGSKKDGGGNPDTQSIPSSDSGGHELGAMPQTNFTDNDGGGAPKFKFSGQTSPESQYKPKPRD